MLSWRGWGMGKGVNGGWGRGGYSYLLFIYKYMGPEKCFETPICLWKSLMQYYSIYTVNLLILLWMYDYECAQHHAASLHGHVYFTWHVAIKIQAIDRQDVKFQLPTKLITNPCQFADNGFQGVGVIRSLHNRVTRHCSRRLCPDEKSATKACSEPPLKHHAFQQLQQSTRKSMQLIREKSCFPTTTATINQEINATDPRNLMLSNDYCNNQPGNQCNWSLNSHAFQRLLQQSTRKSMQLILE